MPFLVCSLLVCLQISSSVPQSIPGEEPRAPNLSYVPQLPPAGKQLLEAVERHLEEGRIREGYQTYLRLQRWLTENNHDAAGLVVEKNRIGLGLEAHLEKAFRSLTVDGRREYRQVLGDRPHKALQAAGRHAELLSQVLREFPATPESLRALLALGDLAWERGDFAMAYSRFQEFETQAASLREGPQTGNELLLRKFAVARVLDRPERFPDTWQRIKKLPGGNNKLFGKPFDGTHLLHEFPWAIVPEQPAQAPERVKWKAFLKPERENYPLWTFPQTAEDTLLLQTRKFLYRLDAKGAMREPWDLDQEIFDRLLIFSSPPPEEEDRKWECRRPQVTRIAGMDNPVLLLVHGDALPPRYANALAAVEIGSKEPKLLWKRGWKSETDAESEQLVFSPEFLLYGGNLYIGAQKVDADISSYLLCVRPADGKILWKRLIAKGSDIRKNPKRLSFQEEYNVPGSAPEVLNHSILYITNLGIAASLDPADGSIRWTFRYSRAEEPGKTWKKGSVAAEENRFLAVPDDSSWLYSFPAAEGLFPGSVEELLDVAPVHRGNYLAYLGSQGTADFFLDEGAGRTRIVRRNRRSGATVSSFPVSGTSPWAWRLVRDRIFLSDGRNFYSCDTKRDLFWESFLPLEAGSKGDEPHLMLFPLDLPEGILCGVSNRVYWVSKTR